MRTVTSFLLTVVATCGCSTHSSPPGTVPAPSGPVNGNQMYYHGGEVMTSPAGVNLYYIWYGNWSGSTTPAILTDLAKHLGGSPFFNINTTYYDATNAHVRNRLNYLGSVDDAYSQGASLTTGKIRLVIADAILHRLKKDSNAIYVVIGSEDVAVPGFGTSWCGIHQMTKILESDIKFVFVGSPKRYLDFCTPRLKSPGGRSVSPNGNAEADGIANFLVHHLENLISDPDNAGWFDSPSPSSHGAGPEGLDASHKCKQWWEPAFTGAYVSANGSFATVRLGKRDYLIASTWVNANGGYCGLRYP